MMTKDWFERTRKMLDSFPSPLSEREAFRLEMQREIWILQREEKERLQREKLKESK